MAALPIHDIILFVDVVNYGSFTKSAKKNNLTPAAVSKRVSLLEKHVGIRLLNRTTRKIALTESGEILYRFGKDINYDIESAYAAMLDLHNNPRGILTISSPTNFSNIILAPIVTEFSKKHPNIFINVELIDSRKPPEVGSFDIAIRSGQLENSSLIARKLFSIHFVYCASPNYIKKNGYPRLPQDLIKHKVIDYSYREEGFLWTFYQKNQQYVQKITPSISANNALFVKYIAINGGGIACLPDFMIENEIKTGQLLRCFENYRSLSQPIWIIHPYINRYLPKKVQLFLNFIKSILSH